MQLCAISNRCALGNYSTTVCGSASTGSNKPLRSAVQNRSLFQVRGYPFCQNPVPAEQASGKKKRLAAIRRASKRSRGTPVIPSTPNFTEGDPGSPLTPSLVCRGCRPNASHQSEHNGLNVREPATNLTNMNGRDRRVAIGCRFTTEFHLNTSNNLHSTNAFPKSAGAEDVRTGAHVIGALADI